MRFGWYMKGIPGGKFGSCLADPCETDFDPVSPAVVVVYPNDDDALLRFPDTRLLEPNEDCPCLASRPASLELDNVVVACDTLLLALNPLVK